MAKEPGKGTAVAGSSKGNLSGTQLSEATRSFEFAEMNLRHTGNPEKTTALVKRAIRMGYDSVVVNTDIGDPYGEVEPEEDEAQPPPSKKKKKQKGGRPSGVAPIPDPFVVDEKSLSLTTLQTAGKRFRQYSRLTVSLNDTSYVHQFFHSPQLKKYDVIAIRPGNEQIFTTLTRKTDFFDVITFEQGETKISWLYGGGKSKQVQQLADEGIGFELCYGEALKDSSIRRQVLANGRTLIHSTKGGKHVFFASGASEVLDIRAPYDAMNMLVMFGVADRKARPYLSDYPREVLLRAEAKRTMRGALVITKKTEVPAKTLSQEAALARLLKVPEFFVQIEKVPPKEAKTEEVDEEKMEA